MVGVEEPKLLKKWGYGLPAFTNPGIPYNLNFFFVYLNINLLATCDITLVFLYLYF